MTFLHQAISSAEEVAALVTSRASESGSLDFKAMIWSGNPSKGISPADEAAKDVAAFANADGGDIIIGVNDKNSRADGWCPSAGIAGQSAVVRGWLKSHLEPAAVAESIRITELPVMTSTGQQRVLVLNVPPWPYGVVGARVKGTTGFRENAFVFPYRVGDTTKYLSLEEAVAQTNAAHRPAYLKLLSVFRASPDKQVRFANPVIIMAEGHPVMYPETIGGHGLLLEPSHDSFTVSTYPQGFRQPVTVTDEGDSMPVLVSVPDNQSVTIPYELLRASWRDGGRRPSVINVVVDASIVWTGSRWAVETFSRWA